MKPSENLLHTIFFGVTLIALSTMLFYQVFSPSSIKSFGSLRYRPPELVNPVFAADANLITVDCGQICYFIADGRRIQSRTDTDAAGGLPKVKLDFYDANHGLIGYEDDKPNPNFFVIDTKGEFLQVIRLKLPGINFNFDAYYPDELMISFRGDNGRNYLYSANKPELFIQ